MITIIMMSEHYIMTNEAGINTFDSSDDVLRSSRPICMQTTLKMI